MKMSGFYKRHLHPAVNAYLKEMAQDGKKAVKHAYEISGVQAMDSWFKNSFFFKEEDIQAPKDWIEKGGRHFVKKFVAWFVNDNYNGDVFSTGDEREAAFRHYMKMMGLQGQ